MNAKITILNGILIQYETENGMKGVDDSTFYEITNKKEGDIIKLNPKRIRSLYEKDWKVKP